MVHPSARYLLQRHADDAPGVDTPGVDAPGVLEKALAALGHSPAGPGHAQPVFAALDAADGLAPQALAPRVRQLCATGLPLLVLAPPGADAAWIATAYEAGAIEVLPSPLSPAALKAKVGYLLRQAGGAAAELRASEERYRTLFDALDVGVCIIEMLFDADGAPSDYRFLETNPAFVQHTGLTDAVGRTMRELAPEHETHWFDIYGKVATSGQPVRFTDEARALGRWYDAYATRVGGDGSRRVALLFNDITERVRADDLLRRQAEDLSAGDRRKSEFLATLAHELRNPLAPIRSGLQVLRMAGADAAAHARVHGIMERQITHLVALVDDLLDVARITHGQIELKREWIDLADVLASAVETNRPLIDAERHTLLLELPQVTLPVFGDPNRLRQVLSNLLNNAAKYTPRGGRIVLAAAQVDAEVHVTVTDDGIGIAPASLEEVFDMFTQVGRERHRARGGLGIGLSLVRSLAQLHGGSITAASDGPGSGSVFTLRLPLGQRPDLVEAPASAPAAAPRGLRVLVVDDNQDAAATLAELLALTGHTVQVANSGGQALVLAAEFSPQVIFLDLGMPGMNGYQTARALRAEAANADVLLVALTGWGGADDRARTHEAGFDHHLTKPVDLDAILRLLATLPV